MEASVATDSKEQNPASEKSEAVVDRSIEDPATHRPPRIESEDGEKSDEDDDSLA
jgi:hypothetical protein